MDTIFTKRVCDRCGQDLTKGRIMSMFNNDCLCLSCKNKERQRADYRKAADADQAAIRKGNYNYPGIGYEEEKK